MTRNDDQLVAIPCTALEHTGRVIPRGVPCLREGTDLPLSLAAGRACGCGKILMRQGRGRPCQNHSIDALLVSIDFGVAAAGSPALAA
jgi:hypothetical protein